METTLTTRFIEHHSFHVQTTAYVQEWRWKAPGKSAKCDDVTSHNGQYEFRVEAQAGGKDTQDSVTFNIEVYCE